MHYRLNLYTYVLCLEHVFMYSFCQWSAQITNIFVFNSTLITGQLQWWWSYGLFPVKFLVQFFSHNGSSINVSEWLPDYCQGSRENAGWCWQQETKLAVKTVIFRWTAKSWKRSESFRKHSAPFVKNYFKEFHVSWTHEDWFEKQIPEFKKLFNG